MKNQKKITSSKSHQQKKETNGYMALRHNIYDLKLELWHVLKPLEMQLVDIIIHKTIKWNNKESVITTEELKKYTHQHHSEIYRALKSLEEKGVIIRIKNKNGPVIGLNEKFFGDLLIEKHEKTYQARKKKIFLAVDNSKTVCESHTPSVGSTHTPCVEYTHSVSEDHTHKQTEVTEIIEENPLLKKFFKETLINKSLKESQKRGEIKSPQGGEGEGKPLLRELKIREKTQDEIQKEARRQLNEFWIYQNEKEARGI